MKTVVYTKDYCKASPEVQKAIKNAAVSIYEKIKQYEKQGITFNRIFNDDQLKYDKHGEFFTYKCRANKIQLRILYTYLAQAQEDVIIIYDFAVKSRTTNEYIKRFDEANNADVTEILNNSKPIE